MTRDRLLRHGLTLADILLIAGVALMPVLAWKGIRLVEFGLIPLLAAPFVWRRIAPDRNDWLTIALFGQYALLVSINIALYPQMAESTADALERLGLYLGSGVTLILMVMRFRMARDVTRYWRVIAPLAILASVAFLAWDHFRLPPPDNCRVGFLSKHLLIPPLWLTVLAVAGYCGWSGMSGRDRWLRHLCLGAVIVTTVAMSGGRAMLIAQVVTIPILALLLGRGEALAGRARILGVLAAVSAGAFAAGLALDARAGCGFADRLMAIVWTVERAEDAGDLAARAKANELQEAPAAPRGQGSASTTPRDEATEAEREARQAERRAERGAAADRRLTREEQLVGAVYIRPLLWSAALERIRERPLLGHGFLNEPVLVPGEYPQFHQQYLSWLVWGGPLMLASGLLMLFAPLLTFGVRRSQDGAILALAMIAPLGVSFLAATNLMHTVMLLGYVMTLGLLHALARAHDRGGAPAPSGYMGRPRLTPDRGGSP